MGILTVIRDRLNFLEGSGYLLRAPEKSFVYLPETPGNIGADVYFLIAPFAVELFEPGELNSFLEVMVDQSLKDELRKSGAGDMGFDKSELVENRLHIGGFDVRTKMGTMQNRCITEDRDYSKLVSEHILERTIIKEGDVDFSPFLNSEVFDIAVTIKAYPNRGIMLENINYVRTFGKRRKVGGDTVDLRKYSKTRIPF